MHSVGLTLESSVVAEHDREGQKRVSPDIYPPFKVQ